MDDTHQSFGAGADAIVAHWIRANELRRAVADLAGIARRAGVPMLVFKGVALGFAVANDPSFRPFVDADILVHGRAAARSLVRKAAALGFREGARSVLGYHLISASGRFVDVHTSPVPPSFGAVDVRSLFSRARPHPVLGGAMVPNAADAGVLAVAHSVKDAQTEHLEIDLQVLEKYAAVTAGDLAERLGHHGLRRAGLVALSMLAQKAAIWAPWFAALAPTASEKVLARTLGKLMPLVRRRARRMNLVVGPVAAGDGIVRPLMGGAIGAARLLRLMVRDGLGSSTGT
ncbi:MAG: nucleotidyltransferase family protein, partial [Deltaproteobacteria bacterium]|nr:nucleotidyltransferase family protein [Deltaproteobacteria bacterium]